MNILLLGKDGQVGTELRRRLLPLGNFIAVGRSILPMQDLQGIEAFLQAHKPDIIVNAAAYTSVDHAEAEAEMAYLINAQAVQVLAEYAARTKTLILHYSTDYVFDGNKDAAYVESDATNPQNIYGQSKRAGELALIQSQCPHLILRTSWVYAATGRNFVKTILKLAQEKSQLQVVADQFGAPTAAEFLAEISVLALLAYQQRKLTDGIYHVTPTGTTSWYELACYIVNQARAAGIELKLSVANIEAISTEEYPLPAKRPKNSHLDSRAISNALGITLPSWQIYVDRVIEQLRQ